jgi:FlgN protein
MSRPLDDLMGILRLLIQEHRRLLGEMELHQAAINAVNVAGMESSRLRQEAMRQKIALLETRRQAATNQIAAAHRGMALTLTKLAELYPQSRAQMLALRDELRAVIGQISQRTHIAGRVAGAVLGHLNSVVRLISGAVQQAGVYTKQGVPKLSGRIGVIEAVG